MRSLKQLTELALGSKVLDLVQILVTQHIPKYKTTEQQFWTLTALPLTNRTALHQRLFTLTVANVDVAWSGYDPTTSRDTGGALSVRSSSLKAGCDQRLQQSYGSGVRLLGAGQGSPAEDEVTVSFGSLDEARALLDDEEIVLALRPRTLHLISSGQVPSELRRFHNRAFVERLMAGTER